MRVLVLSGILCQLGAGPGAAQPSVVETACSEIAKLQIPGAALSELLSRDPRPENDHDSSRHADDPVTGSGSPG